MKRYWRGATLALLLVLTFVGTMTLDPIAQDPHYHDFADKRTVFGIPNFYNTVSNIPFLIVAIMGGLLLFRRVPFSGALVPWRYFFIGVGLVCFGSGAYHLLPTSAMLVWDRLPMTLAFMALFVALLNEHIGGQSVRYLLWPALIVGIASVGWWSYADDLRPYAWVQFAPLLAIPLMMGLYRGHYTHRIYLLYGLGFYVAAKIAEFGDRHLFEFTGGALSGHSVKHVLAAAGALCIYRMLTRRTRTA